jgi:hypothetical protein
MFELEKENHEGIFPVGKLGTQVLCDEGKVAQSRSNLNDVLQMTSRYAAMSSSGHKYRS